jgi:methionyl-tRNA formyltransferase
MTDDAGVPAAPAAPAAPAVEPPPLPTPPAHPTRLVFLGTPEMAVPPLRALHAAGHDIALVVSRADKRRGRGSQVDPSPVKAAAIELGIPVTDQIDDALDVGADLGVVVAYGRIIKRPVLERLPMINLHFSRLPRWRGAAPVERAILAGDEQTGVDVMAVEEGLDTGGIYAEVVLDIAAHESADELRARLVDAGTALLIDTLRAGIGSPRPQIGEAIYAEKLTAAEHEIDWQRSAEEIDRLVRVGGAWTQFRGKRFKIWRVERRHLSPTLKPGEIAHGFVGTGEGALWLAEVQPEGKPRQAAAAWANGARLEPVEWFGR